MFGKKAKSLSLILSVLLCVTSFNVPVLAEEEIPAEEPVEETLISEETQVQTEETEISEESDEGEELAEPEEAAESEESADPETEEEAEPEEEVLTEETSDEAEEPLPEEASEEEEEQPAENEEEEDAETFAASDFTYTVANNAAEIKGYTGTDTAVVIPSTIDGYPVTSIGYRAFYQNTAITSVEIPEGVTQIGMESFYGCTALERVTMPESVTSIGQSSFYKCSNLSYINIPAGVTSMTGSFDNTKLTSAGPYGSGKNIEINYPETITTMYTSSGLFTYITELELSGNIRTIKNGALKKLMISSLMIPEGVTSIERTAFYECTSLTKVILSSTLTKFGDNIFYGCTGLKTVGPLGSGSDIEFAWTDAIPSNAFQGDNCIKSVTIPDTVTQIGAAAFESCSGLTSIRLSNNITNIDKVTFQGCSSLPEITIPDSVTSIGQQAFSGCSSLAEVTFPANLSTMADNAFSSCSSLESIEIPEGTRKFGASVFSRCSSLVSVSLPESLTDLGASTFRDCTSLVSITLPNNLTMAGYTFSGCINLKSVVWPLTFEYVPAQTFENCVSLTDINLYHVNSIGSKAFAGCTSLETVECAVLSSVANNAFEGCTSLKKVSLIENVGFNSQTNKEVSTISPYVFKDCSGLQEIWLSLPGDTKTIGAGAFMNCPDHMTIHFFGTASDWNSISIGSDNDALSTARIIYEQTATSLSISGSSYELGIGDGMQLNYSVTPSSYSKDNLIWASSKPEIVSVDQNGFITAHSGGSATISLKAPNSNAYATCTVKVGVVSLRGISIAPASDFVSVGKTVDLDPVFDPANAANKNVTWTSSDSSVATVDRNGVVTGVKVGNVTITVKAEDGGFTAKKEMTVINPVTGVTLNTSELSLAIGDTGQLTASVIPEDAGNKTVNWSSSNEGVAAVDSEGVVTALSAGTAVITVTTADGGFTDTCTVTCYAVPAQNISIDEEGSVSEIEFGNTGVIQVTFEPANTTNQKLLWASSNPSVATVDENGVVTAVGEGLVTITATSADGGFTASKEINILYYHIESIAFEAETADVAEGTTKALNILFTPENASNKTVTFTSDNEEVVTVDEEGNITGVSEGEAVVTAVSEDGNKTASVTVTVVPKVIYISGLETSYTYTGAAVKPEIQVYDSGVLLTPKTDYTVTYKNTTKYYQVADPDKPTAKDKKSAPQITVKANAKGNYTGTKTVYFSIDKADLSSELVTVDELSAQAGTKKISPVPVVYFNGKKLKNKTDYTVDYNGWDQLTPGDQTILIHGKGNFDGTREVTVHVAPDTMKSVAKLTVSTKTLKYADLEEGFEEKVKAAIIVKDGKKVLTADPETEEGPDYYIEGITDEQRAVGTFKVTLRGNTDKGFNGTRTVAVKITGTSIKDKKVKVNKPSYDYDGNAVPLGSDFEITYGTTSLVKDVDYRILEDTYKNNINSGTASVTIEGINGYTGTRTVSYLIRVNRESLTEDYVQMDDTFEYVKGGVKPEPVLPGLKKGTDYTVTYKNNTKVTENATATIAFKGNYKGVKAITKHFSISEKPLDEVTVTAKDMVVSAKAGGYKSTPALKDSNGKALKAGTDYEKAYVYEEVDSDENVIRELGPSDKVEAGSLVRVTVTGKDNYSESVSAVYRILETGKDISKLTFTIASKEYTGRSITLEETDIKSIKSGKKVQDLVLGRDYEIVDYSNNLNKGTAKVTFRGINDYGGVKTVSFKITGKGLLANWFDGYGHLTLSGYNISYMTNADVSIDFTKAKLVTGTLTIVNALYEEEVVENANIIKVKPGSTVKISDAVQGDTTDAVPYCLEDGKYYEYARGITISSGNVSDWPTTVFGNGDKIVFFYICLKNAPDGLFVNDYFIMVD